jgi:hypothetical protein
VHTLLKDQEGTSAIAADADRKAIDEKAQLTEEPAVEKLEKIDSNISVAQRLHSAFDFLTVAIHSCKHFFRSGNDGIQPSHMHRTEPLSLISNTS